MSSVLARVRTRRFVKNEYFTECLNSQCPWVDVVMARINPKGAKMDGKPEEVIPILEQMKKNGKAVIGMKIYGEGTLAHMKDECIEFAQDLGLLDAMTIGAESTSQLDETLRLLSRHPAAPVS